MAADNVLNTFGDLWEVAARWDGEFEGFGLSFGGGYSNAALDTNVGHGLGDSTDDLTTWNVGGNVTFSGFSFGAAYLDSQEGVDVGVAAGGNDVQEKTGL